MHQPPETQTKGRTNPPQPKTGSKTRGNLAATLDPQLRPRRLASPIGRPKGARNYEWTPEIDRLLAQLCAERAPAAKRTVAKPFCPRFQTVTLFESVTLVWRT